MDYYVSEVFPSSAVNDAVLIPSFYEEHDALALAKGNHLVIYMIEDEYVTEPKSFEIYGVIKRLIPVCYSHAQKSNLLVILTDLRTCILKTDDNDPNHLITESVGTFQNAWESANAPIRYAIHPTCLIIQLENYQLDLYPIKSNCTLDDPFKIKVGRKSIIGFQFIGPTSKVTRLAVLTEEYNKPPMVHLFEIDPMNRSYSEDPSFDIILDDAYFMIPYDLDAHSIVVVFSTQQATRVMYNELKPYKKTATIFTLDRLIKMSALTTKFHIAIDQANKLHAVDIKEVGQVSFVKIANVPPPSELVAITANLAFVASEKDDSVFLAINQENGSYNASVFDTLRSTGKIINFREFGDSIISIYERAVIQSQLMCEYNAFLQVEFPEFLRVFSFYFEGKSANCFVFSNELLTSIVGENIDGEFIDFSDMFDTSSQTFDFYALEDDLYVQVTSQKIYIYKYNIIPDSDGKVENICTDLKIGNFIVSQVSRYGNAIAILTNENVIFFYDIVKSESQAELGGNDDGNIIEAEKEENPFSYEIRKRTQKIIEKTQVSSISLSNDFFAVSCFNPYKLMIYHYQDDNFVFARSVETGPIIDLIFHNGSFYALSPTKKVTLIQPNMSTITVINCNGRHSTIRPINDRTVIICGPDPAVIIGYDKIYPLKVKDQILDATYSDGRISLLTNNSLLLGNISQPFYVNNSYSTRSKLLDIIPFENMNVFIRYNTNNLVVFYSCLSDPNNEKTDLEAYFNDDGKDIFGGLKKDENYVDYIKYNNNSLIISSSNRIIIYKLVSENKESKKFVLNHFKEYQKQISKIGTFRNYFYIQFCEEIQFYYPSSFISEKIDDVRPVFIISNSTRIMHSAFSNQLVAFVYSKKSIAIYSFDDYNERMIQFPRPFQSTETITSLSIISETVIFGTNHGNIFSLDLIPDISSNSMSSKFEIDVKEGYNTDEMIVKMTAMNNNSFIMAAGANGISLKIDKFGKKHPKFYDFYRILSVKLTSVGLFRKEYQRNPKVSIYLPSIMQMCDKDLLSTFASLDTNEKEKILEGSDISLELANEILQFEGI